MKKSRHHAQNTLHVLHMAGFRGPLIVLRRGMSGIVLSRSDRGRKFLRGVSNSNCTQELMNIAFVLRSRRDGANALKEREKKYQLQTRKVSSLRWINTAPGLKTSKEMAGINLTMAYVNYLTSS